MILGGGNGKDGKRSSQFTLWLLAAVLSLIGTFMAIQWQQTEAEVSQLDKRVEQVEDEADRERVRLEAQHDNDIARLDESNRNRRNDLAELEERVARLEERTK